MKFAIADAARKPYAIAAAARVRFRVRPYQVEVRMSDALPRGRNDMDRVRWSPFVFGELVGKVVVGGLRKVIEVLCPNQASGARRSKIVALACAGQTARLCGDGDRCDER